MSDEVKQLEARVQELEKEVRRLRGGEPSADAMLDKLEDLERQVEQLTQERQELFDEGIRLRETIARMEEAGAVPGPEDEPGDPPF